MDVSTFLNKPSFEKGNIFEVFCYSYLQRQFSDRVWYPILDQTPSEKMSGDYGVDIWSRKDDKIFLVQCKVRPIEKSVVWEECTNMLGYGLNLSYLEKIPIDNIYFIFMGTSKNITNKFLEVPNRTFFGWDELKDELVRYLDNLTEDVYNMIKVPQKYFEIIESMPRFCFVTPKAKINKDKFVNTLTCMRPHDEIIFIEDLSVYDNPQGVEQIKEAMKNSSSLIGLSKKPLIYLKSIIPEYFPQLESITLKRGGRKVVSEVETVEVVDPFKEKIKQGMNVTIPEIKKYLMEKGISFKSNDRKAELLAKIS